MLQPIMDILQTQRIILASGSPRRKQILEVLGFPFEVKVSDFEEDLNKADFNTPYEYAIQNARLKANAVADQTTKTAMPADLVIGADTVVALNNKIFEKPRSCNDAIAMLTSLSGARHTVFTGVALIHSTESRSKGYDVITFHEATDVFMADLPSNVIKAYVESGEPMDKAGSYAIQGRGASLITGIHGDYYNVMGFPLYRFCENIAQLYKNKAMQK